MEPVSEETKRLMDDLSGDELDSAFNQVVLPPVPEPRLRAPAPAKTGERLHSLVGQVKRLTEDERVHMQAVAGADEWFVRDGGRTEGPYSLEQMKARWMAGLIGPESECWGIGLAGWTPQCRISALTRALGPEPEQLIPLPAPSVPATPAPPPPEPQAAAPAPAKPYLPEAAAVAPAPPPALRAARPALVAHRPSYRELTNDEPAVSPAHRWARVAFGAVAVAAALAFLAMPFLSPPAPELPPAPIEIPEAAAIRPAPAAAARQQTPDRPASQATARKKTPTRAAAPRPAPSQAAEDEAEDTAAEQKQEEKPRSRSSGGFMPFPDSPEVEAEFDRAFGKSPGEPKAAASRPAERSVYVPPPPPKADRPKARLGESDIMRVVVAHKAEVKKCLSAARAEDPELSGKLVMRWTVSTDGHAEDVEALPGDLADTDLAACLEQAIWDWKFPEHTQAQPPVTFPFVF